METVTLKLITKKGEDFCKEDLIDMLRVLKDGKMLRGNLVNLNGGTFFSLHPIEPTIKLLEEKLKKFN